MLGMFRVGKGWGGGISPPPACMRMAARARMRTYASTPGRTCMRAGERAMQEACQWTDRYNWIQYPIST